MGLYEILTDPNRSLYVTEEGECTEAYEMALDFFEERMKRQGNDGEISLRTMYDGNNPEGAMVNAALERLVRTGNMGTLEGAIKGMEDVSVRTGLEEMQGFDPRTLNASMIELLRKDRRNTAQIVRTSDIARWEEQNRVCAGVIADSAYTFTTQLSMILVMTEQPRREQR